MEATVKPQGVSRKAATAQLGWIQAKLGELRVSSERPSQSGLGLVRKRSWIAQRSGAA